MNVHILEVLGKSKFKNVSDGVVFHGKNDIGETIIGMKIFELTGGQNCINLNNGFLDTIEDNTNVDLITVEVGDR